MRSAVPARFDVMTPHNAANTATRQRGAAALVVTMLLFFAMVLVAVFVIAHALSLVRR